MRNIMRLSLGIFLIAVLNVGPNASIAARAQEGDGHPLALSPSGAFDFATQSFPSGILGLSREEYAQKADAVCTAVWQNVPWQRGEDVESLANRIRAAVNTVLFAEDHAPLRAEKDLLYFEGANAFVRAWFRPGKCGTNRGFARALVNFNSLLNGKYFANPSFKVNGRDDSIAYLNKELAGDHLYGACGDCTLLVTMLADLLGCKAAENFGIARLDRNTPMDLPDFSDSHYFATFQYNHDWPSIELGDLTYVRSARDGLRANWSTPPIRVYSDAFWAPIDPANPPKRKTRWDLICVFTPAMEEMFLTSHLYLGVTAGPRQQLPVPLPGIRAIKGRKDANIYDIAAWTFDELAPNLDLCNRYDSASY